MQRAGAKMAALCTPQEVTQPGIYYFEFFVVVAIKALLRIYTLSQCFAMTITVSKFILSRASFSLTLVFFRQPRRVITIP